MIWSTVGIRVFPKYFLKFNLDIWYFILLVLNYKTEKQVSAINENCISRIQSTLIVTAFP
jgi:hypothetical protein